MQYNLQVYIFNFQGEHLTNLHSITLHNDFFRPDVYMQKEA